MVYIPSSKRKRKKKEEKKRKKEWEVKGEEKINLRHEKSLFSFVFLQLLHSLFPFPLLSHRLSPFFFLCLMLSILTNQMKGKIENKVRNLK